MKSDLSIELRMPQTIRIEARGQDVALMDGNRDAAQGEYSQTLPDVVERWVRAINTGLLGGATAPPAKCKATMIRRQRDEDRHHQVWEVLVEAVDWGAFRILANLLRACELDELSARTVSTPGERVRTIDVEKVPFPAMPKALPFRVDRPEESPELSVHLVLGAPSDDVVDEAIAALDLWAELVVGGGYAPQGMDPKRSGSIPTGAILYEEATVAQGFEGPFFADPTAFDAVVSYALALAGRGVAVSAVAIR